MHAILTFHISLTSTLSLAATPTLSVADAGCDAKPVVLRPGENEATLRLGSGTLQEKLYRDMQHRSFDNFTPLIAANRGAMTMRKSTLTGETLIARRQIYGWKGFMRF